MRRLFVALAAAGLMGWMVAGAEAHVALTAKLDAAQEVPAPAGVGGSAGGAITFEFTDEDGKLAYTASVSGLTGDPIAGHLHLGAPGTSGDIKVSLPVLPKNDGVPVSGTVLLDTANVQSLYQGLLYANFHTRREPGRRDPRPGARRSRCLPLQDRREPGQVRRLRQEGDQEALQGQAQGGGGQEPEAQCRPHHLRVEEDQAAEEDGRLLPPADPAGERRRHQHR